MISISACTIVRDEEKNIERWLQNVKTFADEIIVVDTGSQDNTKAILNAQGVECYEFVWCDDFAAAKNFALDQAHGDWIAFLDADEFFDEESQKKLKTTLMKLHGDKKIAGLITPFSNVDENNNNEILSKSWQMRIFRREKNLRFAGKIHESLQNLAPKGWDRDFVVVESLHFIHTGYSRNIMETKLRRNLNILKEEIAAQGGEHPRQYGYLQDCYMGLKEYDKALHYGKLALFHRDESGLLGQENAIICKILFAIEESGIGDYRYELEKALDMFPLFPELWFLYGRYLLERQDEGLRAENSFRKALCLLREPVTGRGDIYNMTIGNIEVMIDNYMVRIERYRNYYFAMSQRDYRQAAEFAIQYLVNAGTRYVEEITDA